MTSLDPGARRLARRRAYTLFARLYRHGVTPDLMPTLAELPVLAESLPASFDADAQLAEHHQLFSLQVFPYGGAFLEPDGRAGGPSAAPVRQVAASLGGGENVGGEGDDYLARSLELLALADERGTPGLVDGEPRVLLAHHLLWWLPVFTLAMAREGSPFWTGVGELTLELCVDHLRSAGGALREDTSPLTVDLVGLPSVGPPSPDELAAYLAFPIRSGLWLSSRTLRRSARRLELPSGFGGRLRVLGTLLESAREYGSTAQLLDQLLSEVAQAHGQLEHLAREMPELTAVARLWSSRLRATRKVLSEIQSSG